ncbi:hypothetical protein EAI_12859 [Harpegnathos saltator]|uniref:Uncharacterized protein n=1 Tax=Harpegnathos saltator TaxID=610380 RepID=E2BTI4_HARSA|nr:hypothetical protein EAI_12859 [Harpegnathos saltator]
MIYHKPTTPRFRIAERISVQPGSNRPTYNKQNSHSSTCSLRSVGSTPPCISRRQNSVPGGVYDSRIPEGHYDVVKLKVSQLLDSVSCYL